MDLQIQGTAPPRDLLRCQIICVLIDYTHKKLWITTFAIVDDWNVLRITTFKFLIQKIVPDASNQDMKKHLKKINLMPHPHL